MVDPCNVSTIGRPSAGPVSASMSMATFTDRKTSGSACRNARSQARTSDVVLIDQRRGAS